MAPKKGKNTNPSTSRAALPPAVLCIRCPDVGSAKDNRHQNNFANCSNKYPTQSTANTTARKSANELWWPFAEGENNFTFATIEGCDQLLDFAKQAVADAKDIQPTIMESVPEIKQREKALKEFRKEKEYDGKEITKGSLEAALIRKAELKRARKEGRKQDHEIRERQKAALAEGTGKAIADGTFGNSQAPFVNPPGECLRCPRSHRQKAAEHFQDPHGLVACQLLDFNVANRWNPQDLWPAITINYNDLDRDEKEAQKTLNPFLMGPDAANHDAVREVWTALKNGQVSTDGSATLGAMRFTKKIAEDVVTAMAQSTSIALAGAGAEDESSSGEADTGNGTVGVGSGSQPAAPSVGVAGPPVGVAPPTQPSASRKAQAQHYTKNDPAPNANTGRDQRTDQGRVNQNLTEVAENIARSEHIGPSGISSEESDAQILKIARKFGLRTEFASKASKPNIRTNFLTMTWPSQIHVYSVEMIRPSLQNNARILVKRQADKLSVMDVIKTQSLPQHLSHVDANGVPRSDYWVTDGDLIWSTKPLFDATDAAMAPGLLSTFSNTQVQYINEMGDQLTLADVDISFLTTLILTQSIGKLFYDSSAPSWDDGTPGLISRGLNLFFTRFARENANNNTTTTLNKSFINADERILDNATAHRTMFALRGFFLSVRPGVESLYLNINRATSPFIKGDLTVQEMMDRLIEQQGRSEGEARAVLKGLKVRIIYDKVVNFATDQQRIRFINCIGKKPNDGPVLSKIDQVSANPTYQTHGHQTVTVHDWYTPPQFQNDPDAPSSALTLTGNEFAVNVGKDPHRDRDNVWWIPATQLRIEPWQKFHGRLTTEQTTNMLAAALMEPAAHKDKILGSNPQGGLHHFGFSGNVAAGPDNRQGLLQTNKMSAGTDFINLTAFV